MTKLTLRKTKKDKRKKTFDKFGKNTQRGLRIKLEGIEKKAKKRHVKIDYLKH